MHTLIPSYKHNVARENVLYVFNHYPKCAGTSFTSGLCAAFDNRLQKTGNSITGRVEKENIDEFVTLANNEARKGIFIDGFISSTVSRELLDRIELPVKQVSLFRDPVKRIKSHYAYLAMREGRSISTFEFRDFINLEENKNIYAKSLSSSDSDKYDVTSLIQSLDNTHYTYGSISDLTWIMSSILSMEGLPNVIMDRANKTLPEYCLTEEYESINDELISLNSLDIEIFNRIKSKPKLLSIGHRSHIADRTIIQTSTQVEDGATGTQKVILTQDLKDDPIIKELA